MAPALIADPGSHSPSSLPPTSFLSPQTAIFSVLCVSHLPEQHGPSLLVKSHLLRVQETPTDGFTLAGFGRVSAEFCSHFPCRQSFVRRRFLLMDWAVASSVWPHPDSCRGGFLLFQGHARAEGLARCLSNRFIYNESL